MNTVQATIYGAELNLANLFGRAPIIVPSSSVNERLDIFPTAKPTATERVYLGVLTCGMGGHRGTIGDQGVMLTSIIDHTADHASLYIPRPLLMRPINDDIPLAKRNKYAWRKRMQVGTEWFYAYWGYRLTVDLTNVPIKRQWKIMENGVPRYEPFVPDGDQLYPKQLSLPTSGAVTATDVSLIVTATITVTFDEEDIAEGVNVAKIMNNGDERYAVWSEFALCTGADRTVTVESTGGNITFKEFIGAQIYAFSADHKALYYNSQELSIKFDVGNQVPMLATQSIPTLETTGSL